MHSKHFLYSRLYHLLLNILLKTNCVIAYSCSTLESIVMPMRCYFLNRQVTIKFWPVYKLRLIFWTDFEDLKGQLIHRKVRYLFL